MTCCISTDGNDDGLFGVNRTSDNRGMIYVKGRIDREAVSVIPSLLHLANAALEKIFDNPNILSLFG